jgi:hypothetical protein
MTRALSKEAVAAVEKYLSHDEADIARLISEWCKKAQAPNFDGDALAQLIAIIISLLSSSGWRDDFSEARKADRTEKRTREVIEALRVLQTLLPQFIEDWRLSKTPAPLDLTLSLLELVGAHQPWINALPPARRGPPQSRERDVTSFLARKALELWKGKAGKTQADGFASEAVAWLLDKPQSDGAISKARRRRT